MGRLSPTLTSHLTLSQKGREAALFDFFSPQAALSAFFPRKETFHTPLPLQSAKAEPGSLFQLPGALTVQGNGSKTQQLPTGPGTQSWDSRSFHGKASRPNTALSLRQSLSSQQGRPEGQAGETGLCTSYVEVMNVLAPSHLSPSFPAVT